MIINEGTERETLERHYLCRVLDEEFGIPIYRVLCVKCRNKTVSGFKRIAFSELPCDQCGAKYQLPQTTKAIKYKDKTVTITARYPDLESARNDVS